MRSRVIKALVKKDLRDIFRNKTLLSTIIIIPVIFSVVLPALFLIGALFFDMEKAMGNDANKLLEAFLASSPESSVSLETVEKQIVYLFIHYLLPSLFLLVPIITASVVAANSFVGEKERRTLESLLFSPMSIKELFVGKVVASFIPSSFVSVSSFIISGILINALAYPLFHDIIFPSTNWIVLITCLSPMVTLMTVLLNVLISSRVKTFQEAQNIGGIIVLPVIGLMVGQISGLFLLGVQLTLLISLGLLIVNVILLHRITKHNDRFLLFEKQIH